MNHADLVHIGFRWLHRQGYQVILSEASDMQQERPDIIGWKNSAIGVVSCLIECKVSLRDYARDRSKPARQQQGGMGNYRYYLIPHDLGRVDLPLGWGLLHAEGNRVQKIEQPLQNHNLAAIEAERTLLYVALKRRMSFGGSQNP